MRMCKICGEHDDPQVMNKYRKQHYHARCNAIASKTRRAQQREIQA